MCIINKLEIDITMSVAIIHVDSYLFFVTLTLNDFSDVMYFIKFYLFQRQTSFKHDIIDNCFLFHFHDI